MRYGKRSFEWKPLLGSPTHNATAHTMLPRSCCIMLAFYPYHMLLMIPFPHITTNHAVHALRHTSRSTPDISIHNSGDNAPFSTSIICSLPLSTKKLYPPV